MKKSLNSRLLGDMYAAIGVSEPTTYIEWKKLAIEKDHHRQNLEANLDHRRCPQQTGTGGNPNTSGGNSGHGNFGGWGTCGGYGRWNTHGGYGGGHGSFGGGTGNSSRSHEGGQSGGSTMNDGSNQTSGTFGGSGLPMEID